MKVFSLSVSANAIIPASTHVNINLKKIVDAFRLKLLLDTSSQLIAGTCSQEVNDLEISARLSI